MREHISPKQAKELKEEQFYGLFSEIVKRTDWANYHHKKVTIGKLNEVIRSYCQMALCSKLDGWEIQLFPIFENIYSTSVPLYKGQGEELIDVLFDALQWILMKETELDNQLLDKLLGVA